MTWKKGESGNPKGGGYSSARRALNNTFFRRLREDFEEHGVSAIEKMRESDPGGYVRMLASLLPQKLELEADVRDSRESLDLRGASAKEVVAELRRAVAEELAGSSRAGSDRSSIPPGGDTETVRH